MNLKELLEKRAKLVKQARDILDKVDEEKRNMSQEEINQYDKIDADIDAINKRIDAEKRTSDFEKTLEDSYNNPIKGNPEENRSFDNKELRAQQEYREAFYKAVREGASSLTHEERGVLMDREVRSMAIGTDAAGGYVVPDEFERNLVKILEEQNIMRGLATVIQTASGTREIPVESSYGSATWLGEEAAYTESDASFSQITLGAHKLGTIIKISEELLQDSFFDMPTYITNAFGRRFAKAEETAFVNGNGTGKPTGVVNGSTQGKVGTTGQTTSITADDLIDLYHSLSRVYRSNARFMANDDTIKAVRKLKDSDGQYIWQPGLQAGQPDRLLGRPVAISEHMPTMAASAKSVLFGDFSHYWIADRKGRTMQRLDELYAATGQTGFRMYQRVDGKLTRTDAVKHYQNSAS